MRIFASILYLFFFLLCGQSYLYKNKGKSLQEKSKKEFHFKVRAKLIELNSSPTYFEDSETDTNEDDFTNAIQKNFSKLVLNQNNCFFYWFYSNKEQIIQTYTSSKFYYKIRVLFSPIRIQSGIFRI